MQSVSSRIWTSFAGSISYDANDYTTGTLKKIMIMAETYYHYLAKMGWHVKINQSKVILCLEVRK